MPFVWPEPRVSEGVASYLSELPFQNVIRSADTIFGDVSAVDSSAINWIESFMSDQVESQLLLVVSNQPVANNFN